MATLFISDLHLDASRPEATECFLQFLRNEAASADALYILGDLFEVWVGDDDPDAHVQTVIRGIKVLTDTGTPCFFMRGNRDLIVGSQFAERTGMTMLPDPTLVSVHGASVLLMHGDLLCTDDLSYQRYRRVVHNPLMQTIYRHLPFWLRNKLVAGIRTKSIRNQGEKPRAITDVNQNAVVQSFRDFNVATLLHGHTHRQAMHELEVDKFLRTRIVLGDWYEQGSVLKWDRDGPQFYDLRYT